MKIISLGENEKNENIPLGTIMREKSCCLREDVIKVAYVSFEDPLHACPVIRILSPFRMIGDAVFLYSPVKHIKGRPVLKKSELYLADILLVQRATFFSDHSIAEIKGPWQKTIYEIDDLLIDIPQTNPNWKLNKDRAKIIGLIKDADVVTVSTERLKKHFQSCNRNINVIPNYIDPDIWNIEEKRDIRDDGRISIAFIGTPTHNHDLNIIVPAIKKILATYRNRVVFRFFGCINEFNRCKSNIKFLEYAICRLPGIYSRIHPYTESIRDGEETAAFCKTYRKGIDCRVKGMKVEMDLITLCKELLSVSEQIKISLKQGDIEVFDLHEKRKDIFKKLYDFDNKKLFFNKESENSEGLISYKEDTVEEFKEIIKIY